MTSSNTLRRAKALPCAASDSVHPDSSGSGWYEAPADSSVEAGKRQTGGRRESGYRSGGWEIPARGSTRPEDDERFFPDRRSASAAGRKPPRASGLYRIGAYRFMMAHRKRWSISAMARVLGVSRQGFYAWGKRHQISDDRVGNGFPSAGFREIGWKVSAAQVERNLRDRGWEFQHDQVAGVIRQARILALEDDGWGPRRALVRAASRAVSRRD